MSVAWRLSSSPILIHISHYFVCFFSFFCFSSRNKFLILCVFNSIVADKEKRTETKIEEEKRTRAKWFLRGGCCCFVNLAFPGSYNKQLYSDTLDSCIEKIARARLLPLLTCDRTTNLNRRRKTSAESSYARDATTNWIVYLRVIFSIFFFLELFALLLKQNNCN